MLASISPVGEASRRQRWPVTATAYLVGSGLGGLAVGTLLGLVGAGLVASLGGALPPSAVLAALGLVAAYGLAVDQGRLPGRLPSWHRQVDEGWLTAYRGWAYGFGFGVQLGAGVLTRVPTVATHLTLLAAVGTGSVAAGAAIGTTFGVVRALPLLLARRLTDPARLNHFHARMEGATRPVERGTRAAVLVSLLAAGAAVAAM